jgi:crossover junction endodeoxyribonuclease RuvC
MGEVEMGAILALDLGTKCGFCLGVSSQTAVSGVWDLKHDRFAGGGMRYVRFRSKLNEVRAALPISLVVFEEVRKHAGTDAAHVYGGLMAILTEWCESKMIPYQGVPVGTIKKHWTGKGNASKDQMIAECNRREMAVVDDNEADAIALFDYAITDAGDDTWEQNEMLPDALPAPK